MIHELYMQDIETNDPDYMLRLTPVLDNGPIKSGRNIVHLEVVAVESTFSRTQFTMVGADPKVDSDSGFEHEKASFVLDLDAAIDALTLLRKHGG